MSRSAADRLARALKAALADHDCAIAIETRSRPWASVTFTGERHEMTMVLVGLDAIAAADALVDEIGEREFDLRRHIVIDIALTGRRNGHGEVALLLDALTVDAD